MNEINSTIEGYAGGVSKTSSCVEKSTAFNAANRAANEVCALVSRVVDLSEKLVGPVLPSDSKQADVPAMPGLLGILETSAQTVVAQVKLAHEALNRIERGLP